MRKLYDEGCNNAMDCAEFKIFSVLYEKKDTLKKEITEL